MLFRSVGEKEPENRGDMVFGDTELRRAIAARAAARRASPALSTGETRAVYLDPTLFVFARVASDTKWVAVNTGETREFHGHTLPPGVTVFDAPPPPACGPQRVRLAGTAPLAPGDELRAVGAGDTFGHWDPAHGVPLPATLTLNPEVQAFKLVIVHADGSVTWEDGGNRYLLPKTGRVRVGW